jgi:hypothetical protein
LRITGSCRASDVHWAEQQRLDLVADLFGTEFLEEAGVEVAGIVDQDVDPAELGDGGCDRGLGVLARRVTSSLIANRSSWWPIAAVTLAGSRPVAINRVASGQRCLGNVEAQATACAGDEPNFLVSHGKLLGTIAGEHRDSIAIPCSVNA